MKIKIIFILTLININLCYSQYEYNWSKFGISFKTDKEYDLQPLYEKSEDQNTLWRLDSDEIGVEIDVLIFSKQTAKYIKNVEYAAMELAEDMEYKPVSKGEHILENFRSYYVKSVDIFDGNIYPVIIAVIIDDKNELTFEIVIDCYDNNLQNGINLLNSIKYVP